MYDGISKQIDIVDKFLYLGSLFTTGGSFAFFDLTNTYTDLQIYTCMLSVK